MKILAIDTSSSQASVAVADENNLLGEVQIFTQKTHSQVILPLVQRVLADTNTDINDIDLCAVNAGPGSYTGLRIGIAAVKGICFGDEKKCIGVSSLEAAAYNIAGFDGDIVAVMKARANVVYAGGYFYEDHANTKLVNVFKDRVCDEEDVVEYISIINNIKSTKTIKNRVMLVGDFSQEFKDKYFKDNSNVLVAPMNLRLPRAGSIVMSALNNIDKAATADVLEARYLQATKAQKDKAH